MASKYTRAQVIEGRKCGLDLIDKAVAVVGMQKILEDTVQCSKRHPTTWGGGWDNASWAFGQVWRDVLHDNKLRKGEIGDTVNFDEVLNEEQMAYLAKELSLTLSDYKPPYARRPVGKELVPKTSKPGAEAKLTTKAIRDELVSIFEKDLADPTTDLYRCLNWSDTSLANALQSVRTSYSFKRESKTRSDDKTWLRKFRAPGHIDVIHVVTDDRDEKIISVEAWDLFHHGELVEGFAFKIR